MNINIYKTMMRLWCVVVVLAFVSAKAQDDTLKDYDGWFRESDDFDSSDQKLGAVDTGDNYDEYDEQIAPGFGNEEINEEIEEFRKKLDEIQKEAKQLNPSEDYQYEDNRSEVEDDEHLENDFEEIPVEEMDQSDENNDVSDLNEHNESKSASLEANVEDSAKLNEQNEDVPFDTNDQNLHAPSDSDEEDINAPLNFVDKIDKAILEETNAILQSDNSDQMELVENNEKPINNDDIDNEDNSNEENLNIPLDDLQKIFEETGKILNSDESDQIILDNSENIDDKLNVDIDSDVPADRKFELPSDIADIVGAIENDDLSENQDIGTIEDEAQEDEENNNLDDIENDKTVQLAVDADENNDEPLPEIQDEDTMDKIYADLNEDLNKLQETWNKLSRDESDEAEEIDKVLAYESKYGKPYGEDTILSLREDGDIVDDSDLEYNNDDEDNVKFNEELETQGKQPIAYNDDGLVAAEDLTNENLAETNNDNNDNILAAEEKSEEVENIDTDNLIEDNSEQNDEIIDESEVIKKQNSETSTVKVMSIDDVSPYQYDQLMQQFAEVHKDELDPLSDNFAVHVAPVHITLSDEEATEITSPNYPSPYPTNNIIDWIFEGPGRGIEFNITDFAVNGNIGDYLLVKPGGVDETGTDGLVFTYHLNEARRYRFLGVTRMFVRFQAHLGLGFNRGFKFSIKMIEPIPDEINGDVEPEPEALLPSPPATISVHLGGLSVSEFLEKKEEFRQIVADMANLYINAFGLEHGLNSTFEATQITHTSVCNINWPNFEACTEVRFGVPLIYEDGEVERMNEEDLQAMWYTFVGQDPFALRLRRLGITEFAIPNDSRVLTMWTVVTASAVLLMAILAFVLWRISCFQGYTRMAEYSDNDSIHSGKKNLDLYPTPHQTLPPLYSDADLKWADGKFDDSTRVDMGGYANRSYIRDELFDIDTDEDIVASPRDRYTTEV